MRIFFQIVIISLVFIGVLSAGGSTFASSNSSMQSFEEPNLDFLFSGTSDNFIQSFERRAPVNVTPTLSSGSAVSNAIPLFNIGNVATPDMNTIGGSTRRVLPTQNTPLVIAFPSNTATSVMPNTQSNPIQSMTSAVTLPISLTNTKSNGSVKSAPRVARSTNRSMRTTRQPEVLQPVAIELSMFAGYSDIKPGAVLTTSSSLKSGTSGVFREPLKVDGVVILTSNIHNYFIKIPVLSGAVTWNINNTTTPSQIVDRFMYSGNQTVRVNFLQKGAKKSSGQGELQVFAIDYNKIKN